VTGVKLDIPCSLATGFPYLSFRIPNRVEDRLDAESSFFVFSGFLLEFIPHFDAGQE